MSSEMEENKVNKKISIFFLGKMAWSKKLEEELSADQVNLFIVKKSSDLTNNSNDYLVKYPIKLIHKLTQKFTFAAA